MATPSDIVVDVTIVSDQHIPPYADFPFVPIQVDDEDDDA